MIFYFTVFYIILQVILNNIYMFWHIDYRLSITLQLLISLLESNILQYTPPTTWNDVN